MCIRYVNVLDTMLYREHEVRTRWDASSGRATGRPGWARRHTRRPRPCRRSLRCRSVTRSPARRGSRIPGWISGRPSTPPSHCGWLPRHPARTFDQHPDLDPGAAGGEPGRSARREATRRRLLDAAREVFAERGVIGGTVEDICEHAGYTRGAFYSNFTDKDEVLVALVEREHALLLGHLESSFALVDREVAEASGSRRRPASVVDRSCARSRSTASCRWSRRSWRSTPSVAPTSRSQLLEANDRFRERIGAFIDQAMRRHGRELLVSPADMTDIRPRGRRAERPSGAAGGWRTPTPTRWRARRCPASCSACRGRSRDSPAPDPRRPGRSLLAVPHRKAGRRMLGSLLLSLLQGPGDRPGTRRFRPCSPRIDRTPTREPATLQPVGSG